MKKLITLSIAAITATVMASAAYAGGDLQQHRLADENAAYFHQTGNTASSNTGTVTKNPDYDFAASPQQRTTVRNDTYWAKAGYSKTETPSFVPTTGVSEYPFPGSVPANGGYIHPSVTKK